MWHLTKTDFFCTGSKFIFKDIFWLRGSCQRPFQHYSLFSPHTSFLIHPFSIPSSGLGCCSLPRLSQGEVRVTPWTSHQFLTTRTDHTTIRPHTYGQFRAHNSAQRLAFGPWEDAGANPPRHRENKKKKPKVQTSEMLLLQVFRRGKTSARVYSWAPR